MSKKILSTGRPSAAKASPTLSDLADKRATVRVNFDLDRTEHMRLKIYAAKTGRSITDILRELVRSLNEKSVEYVSKQVSKQVSKCGDAGQGLAPASSCCFPGLRTAARCTTRPPPSPKNWTRLGTWMRQTAVVSIVFARCLRWPCQGPNGRV